MPTKRSLKIAHISDLALDEILSRTVEVEIVEHLAKRGHEVQLIAIISKDTRAIMFRDARAFCFPLRSVPVLPKLAFQVIISLFLPIYVLAKKPDVILTVPGFSILSFLWKPILSRCTKVKIILDIRSTPVIAWEDRRTRLLAFLFTISVLIAKRLFDGITTVTPAMKEDLVTRYLINSDFIRVWSNGVSTSLFDPKKYTVDGMNLRKHFHLGNAFVVFYHGSISQYRGVLESVKSIAELNGKYGDVILFFLGSGTDISMIRTLAHDNGLNNRIIIHEPVRYSEVPKYIAMSDVGIVPLPNMPDWRHQFPLKLVEYLAMEKPVIVTDILCNRSIVGESKCAIYVRDADPAEIAKAIRNLHDRRTALNRLGPVCRRIANKYEWIKVAELLEEELISIVDGPTK